MNRYILINSLGAGGAEKQVSLISSACSDLIIVQLNNDIRYKFFNGDVRALSSVQHSSFYETLKIPFYVSKLIYLIISKFKRPDFIASFLVRANLVNILVGKIIGYKIIISERNTPSKIYTKGLSRYYGKLIKILYPYADRIIVNSYGIKRDLILNYKINPSLIKIINNSIDMARVGELSKVPIDSRYDMFFKDNQILINVGSLTKQKNQEYLIHILQMLRDKYINYKLVLIGMGDCKTQLVTLAAERNLNVYDSEFDIGNVPVCTDILFLGYRDNPYKYISASTVLLFPSLWEGFPNVILESIACKTVVISSDCESGPREILNCGDFQYRTLHKEEIVTCGILLPPPVIDNLSIWCSSIIKCVESLELRSTLTDNGYKEVFKYDLSRSLYQWMEVLEVSNDCMDRKT
jgi:glycosyltransferase involved in cell wall biosynthesis